MPSALKVVAGRKWEMGSVAMTPCDVTMNID
jgi:hypothetical protein